MVQYSKNVSLSGTNRYSNAIIALTLRLQNMKHGSAHNCNINAILLILLMTW